MRHLTALIPEKQIDKSIDFIRDQRVILDSDLADLYEVSTKALNQAVRRNRDRFPEDFMFQLTHEESSRIEPVTNCDRYPEAPRPRFRAYAFTEQGVAMLSSVLRSKRAVLVNIAIMRAFVRLRLMLASNVELARKLDQLEKKYDRHFKIVFNAIRQLMTPPTSKPKQIGFRPKALKK